MNPEAKKILDQLRQNEPASAASIQLLLESCGIDLPDDYLEFLKLSNGAAGTLPNSYHLILWPAERLVERNRAYEVQEYAPGIFIFGSSGGGEAYGFDARSSMDVIQVPFVGMDLSDVEHLAPSFTQFLISLGKGLPNAS